MQHAIEPDLKLRPRKPSTAFLVVLNALAFLVLLLPGSNLFGLIIAVPMTAIFLAVSGVWQTIWAFLDRRFHFHNIVRCVGFVLPVTALVVLPYLGVRPTRPINKQRPAVSLSGKHKAFVLADSAVWHVQIQDQAGRTLRYDETDFISNFEVYWIWGPDERLWVYNSDDGCVHCWYAKLDGRWHRVRWGRGHSRETDVELGRPPDDLYPAYARHMEDPTEQSQPNRTD